MNMPQIRAIAKERGVKSNKLLKVELVQAIQSAEGNEQCYGTGKAARCGQTTCLWKDDCN
jgi:hypothetical protein